MGAFYLLGLAGKMRAKSHFRCDYLSLCQLGRNSNSIELELQVGQFRPNWTGHTIMNNLHNFTRGALKNRPLVALSNDDIARLAPSAFAEHAHESRSKRYAYIPTFKVIDALRTEGFFPVEAGQSRSRCGREDFTKHMIKFARFDSGEGIRVGDSVPQVNLVNSHDGTSTYNLIAGLYRLVCSNGLMVADSCVQSIKVQHSGDIVDRVIEGSFTVIDGAAKAGRISQDWGRIPLNAREQEAFANAASLLRWNEDNKAPPIDPRTLLNAHRMDDTKGDLWTTFNRVQENIVRGGQRGRDANGRRFTVRPVDAIDGNVKLNRALWSLAEQMATLKVAA
jgi:hypothetical protein